MHTNDYLFPRRLGRRDFLKLSSAAAAGLALPAIGGAQQKKNPVRIGSGHHTYTLDEEWGKLPAGMKYGFGCAIVVDSKDRVYVTSRSANPCVAVFDRHGKLLETWAADFAGQVGLNTDKVVATAHGLYWSKEGRKEFFYFTENVAGGKDGAARIGARVYKTDLKGRILFEIGNVAKETSTAVKFDFTNPTDVAVAPNGDIYIVDGYGSQLVHRFDKHFKLIKTIGGRGKENGKFNTCHGVWINTLRKEPEVYIADRHNDRLEVYSLDLEYRRTLKGDHIRNPCCFYQHKGHLYVPDLAAMVTVMDAQDQLVARLGDGKGKADNRTNPALFATPHALTLDSHGDLYVVEWVDFGRPRKFKHTPQA